MKEWGVVFSSCGCPGEGAGEGMYFEKVSVGAATFAAAGALIYLRQGPLEISQSESPAEKEKTAGAVGYGPEKTKTSKCSCISVGLSSFIGISRAV